MEVWCHGAADICPEVALWLVPRRAPVLCSAGRRWGCCLCWERHRRSAGGEAGTGGSYETHPQSRSLQEAERAQLSSLVLSALCCWLWPWDTVILVTGAGSDEPKHGNRVGARGQARWWG